MREERRRSIVGRGAAGNPKNRFEGIEVEPLEPEDGSRPETVYLRDHSRSIVTRNDSPDIGFDASINPYRGCSHGCAYCMTGDTPVLIGDGTTRPLAKVRVDDEIYGTIRVGSYRRYTKTSVSAHWSVEKRAYRITLEDGTVLVAGGDHRFLTERGWKFVTGGGRGRGCRPRLTTNNKLVGVGTFAAPPRETLDYKRGYLCGLVRGDGLLAFCEYEREGRMHGNQHQFRLALVDREALDRAARYLLDFDVATRAFTFTAASSRGRTVEAIRTHARSSVDLVRNLVAWPESPSDDWHKGFLAGIFDAEGSYSCGILRIPNTDPSIIEHAVASFERFGFEYALEESGGGRKLPIKTVRVHGGFREHLRFFHTVGTAISRKREIEGLALKSDANLRVSSIEPLGSMTLFDITTGTGDFIANGVVSHNCYARPTHEYLGLSAGLDFESRVLVKEDAPELIRKELSSPRWEPKVLSMSGVTDPYQPVEGKLGITRRCLGVLAEFRNPVAIVTKNHLVTRDVDLLSELAGHGAAMVAVSLTTLDDDLRRFMEPRTSRPARRLAAIEELAGAGIPVGVMTAPVIPGLTDHELPNLLSSAAGAGATFAAYVPVRLPGAVRPIFEDWLQRHFPDRKEKVLNRIRSMRGGRLNDSRFGSRMKGEGVFAEHLARLFDISCRRAGIQQGAFPRLSTVAFCRPEDPQGTLFD